MAALNDEASFPLIFLKFKYKYINLIELYFCNLHSYQNLISNTAGTQILLVAMFKAVFIPADSSVIIEERTFDASGGLENDRSNFFTFMPSIYCDSLMYIFTYIPVCG